jgi:CheY-like chemotaxis protein
MRILIVEDDPETAGFLRLAVCADDRHDCLLAPDGQAAWDLLSEQQFEIVIVDRLLPRLDGLELCRRIRAREHAPYVYLIILTALGETRSEREGLEAGADDYLVKPVALDRFAARLVTAERVVNLHRRREELIAVSRRLAARSGSGPVLEELLAGARLAVGADSAAVWRWDAGRERLVPAAHASPQAKPPPSELSLGQSLAGQAAQRLAVLIDNDYQHSPFGHPLLVEAGIQAVIAVPLLHEGQLLGVLTVHDRTVGKRFSSQDAQSLELLAGTVAAVLIGQERARLEGVLLAVRTAQHELNNLLALTVGYAELISIDPRLPPHLHPLASEALRGAQEAANLLERLRHVSRIVEIDRGIPSGNVIDVPHSTQQR